MNDFIREMQVRWSDLDPNVHLRHSVYYDWGAFCRIEFFRETGLSTEFMHRLQIGPILFREECVFRREIVLGDSVTISLHLLKARRDYSRWSIQHTISKNSDIISAVLSVDGAWLDTARRKLVTPPGDVVNTFVQMPVAANFQWLD